MTLRVTSYAFGIYSVSSTDQPCGSPPSIVHVPKEDWRGPATLNAICFCKKLDGKFVYWCEGEEEPGDDKELRARCAKLASKIHTDAVLRVGSPVDTIAAFVRAEIKRAMQ